MSQLFTFTWPKVWSFSISPCGECPGLTAFMIDSGTGGLSNPPSLSPRRQGSEPSGKRASGGAGVFYRHVSYRVETGGFPSVS